MKFIWFTSECIHQISAIFYIFLEYVGSPMALRNHHISDAIQFTTNHWSVSFNQYQQKAIKCTKHEITFIKDKHSNSA